MLLALDEVRHRSTLNFGPTRVDAWGVSLCVDVCPRTLASFAVVAGSRRAFMQ